MERGKHRRNPTVVRWKAVLYALTMPIILLYSELIFRLYYGKGFFGYGLLLVILFSVLYGLIADLICGIPKNHPRVQSVLKVVFTVLFVLPFLVEHFVLKQFKVLYDIKTISGGAGDVLGGFLGTMLKLIFSPSGILFLLIQLVPVVLILLVAKRIKQDVNFRFSNFLHITSILVLILVLAIAINVHSSSKNGYKEEYNFQQAAQNYGLFTAVRLDILRSGESTTLTINEEGEEVEEEPSYGLNKLDIDFHALASNSDSDVYANMDEYVASLTASSKNQYTGLFQGKNLIFITAEAFSAEAIDKDLTPTLYRLANNGINFTKYYHQATAGTIGGEYQNVFGLLPSSGGASFEKMADNLNYYTMGSQLDRLGYYGIAYHNNDYRYYSRNISHNAIGYSEGFYGIGNGVEEYVNAGRWPESDEEMLTGSVEEYITHQPFNVYYMTVSGHSDYYWSSNAMSSKHREYVESFGYTYSEPVMAYLACQVELDKALEGLLTRLEEEEILDDTVIVIAPDHFPYGLDDGVSGGYLPYLTELYGEEITDDFVKFHNRLIIWSGSLEDEEPIIVDEPTSSLDILPTLSNLLGTEFDSRLMIGRDVFSDAEALYFDDSYNWETTEGRYYAASGTFVPASDQAAVDDEYISRIRSIVANKINFGANIADYDYYRHVFGENQ